MDPITSGMIILCGLILGYICIRMYLYWYRNPTLELRTSLRPSTVTYTYLGQRGDMGNQLFQLACIVAAAKRSTAHVVVPPIVTSLPLNDLFDLSSLDQKVVVPDRTYYEYDNYEPIRIPMDGYVYDIRGYRQSYHYFEDAAENIRRLFRPRESILQAITSVVPPSYLAVHIRRGDYIKKIHAVPLLREFARCELKYYQQGIQHLRTMYPDLPIIVCTDSPTWVKSILSELDPTAMLAPTIEGISPKFSDFGILYLATAVVISNSTYSWWAAYLRNNRPVICPSPWWDPRGFIGTGMGLNGPHLHYPEWWLLDAETGTSRRLPHSKTGEQEDTNPDTLHMYRMIRGILL